jgi:hypothetical protein
LQKGFVAHGQLQRVNKTLGLRPRLVFGRTAGLAQNSNFVPGEYIVDDDKTVFCEAGQFVLAQYHMRCVFCHSYLPEILQSGACRIVDGGGEVTGWVLVTFQRMWRIRKCNRGGV